MEHQKKRKIYSFLSIAVFLSVLIFGTILLWHLFDQFDGDPGAFKAYIESFGIWGKGVFILIQMLQIVFAIIPGEAVEIGAGAIFGPWMGLLLCEIGIAIASTGIFLLVRKWGKPILLIFFDEKQLEKRKLFQGGRRVNIFVFLLFFIPGTPKDLLTYLVGLTNIKTLHFVLITTLARIPSILSSTWIGATLGEQNYALSLIIFGATAFVSLAGYIAYQIYVKHMERRR